MTGYIIGMDLIGAQPLLNEVVRKVSAKMNYSESNGK